MSILSNASVTKFQPKTLWMGNIDPYMDETFVRGLFFGEKELTTVKVIRDKVTGFPAGYGFLEFASHGAAARVLDIYNGKPMPGNAGGAVFRLNWAQYSETSKSGTEFSVFVGDLAPDVSETQLQKVFMENFNSVQSVRIVMDPTTGVSKGYGFVRFGNEDEGREALISMQGVFIGSRPIRVSTATPKKQQALSFEEEMEVPPSTTTTTTTSTSTTSTTTATTPEPAASYPPYYYNYPYSNYYYGYNYEGDMDTSGASGAHGHPGMMDGSYAPRAPHPSTDANLFMRTHDIPADNGNFVLRRLGGIMEECNCGSRSSYYIPVIDCTTTFIQ